MYKFSVGLFSGMVIGAAVGMIMDPLKDKHHKKLTKKKNEMFKMVGQAIDNIMDMF